MLSGEGMELIEEWRFRGVLILMSENSLFGIWYLVYFVIYPRISLTFKSPNKGI